MAENGLCIGSSPEGTPQPAPTPEEGPKTGTVYVRLGTATKMGTPATRPYRSLTDHAAPAVAGTTESARSVRLRDAVPRPAAARTWNRWDSVSDRNVRRLNVLVAAIGLIFALPLMIVIAVAVKFTSRGPVFYHQARVGQDRRRDRGEGSENGRRSSDKGGKLFTMIKFRTMYVRKVNRQVWARPDDPRITPVGRVLRKYRLDEIPQLLNVLRGEMNIVGPRPEQPEIFQELRAKVEGYASRQAVLPGITGWAQVNHHYDQCLDDVRRKVGLDLEYIRRRSPAEDLKIMARTLPVMVGKKGSR